MAMHASGAFEVKLVPQPPEDKAEGSTLAWMSIDKQFHGDLKATSKGQMLSAGTDVKGSAGYVAIERITGTLQGRTGSFVLQHGGTLTRGAPQQSITVVPDSGTGQSPAAAPRSRNTIISSRKAGKSTAKHANLPLKSRDVTEFLAALGLTARLRPLPIRVT